MKKKQLFIYVLLGIFGVSIVAIALLNIKVNYKQEKYINQADTFFDNFNAETSNDNHIVLDSYLQQIGLGKVNKSDNNGENSSSPEMEETLVSLNTFFEKQRQINSNYIEPIPEDLKFFLKEKEQEIIDLRNYILSIKSLHWEYNLNNNFRDPLSYEIPYFINIVAAQKILMLYSLSEYFQGNKEEVNKTLEASFQLNKFIQSQPYLIAQLVALINTQDQIRLLRQTLPLTVYWRENLNNYYYDYSQGILNALKIEAYFIGSPFIFSENLSNKPIAKFIQKPYFQFMSQDLGNRLLKRFSNLENKSICPLDIASGESLSDNIPWWNYLGQIATPNFGEQWLRANLLMLDWELTKNILEVEDIRQKEGNFPNNLNSLNSTVCEGKNWDYRLANNQAFLNFEQNYPEDSLILNSNTVFLPLNFTLK